MPVPRNLYRMTHPARLFALALGFLAALTLILQVSISFHDNGGDLLLTFWRMARYFTILTNLMVAISFLSMGIMGRAQRPTWLMALTLWIVIVGAVYHTLLAHLYDFSGLNWWTDASLHGGVPALTALWWIAFAPKHGLGIKSAALALLWPLIYVIYALIRGAFTGEYPYFFIDVNTLGYGGVALYSAGLCFGFFLGGLALVGLARLLRR